MDAPALVILAAGMGSRFGGDKQLAAIGPGGATISDYLVFDALRAGFGEIVFVIRDGMAPTLDATVRRRFGARAAIRYVVQRADDLPARAPAPAPRAKPWGTGQAVLAAARTIHTPFGVVNADDLYGRAAFTALAAHLGAADASATYALIGFPLRDTLTAAGGVNRAVCEVTADGWLAGLREVTGIERDGDHGRYRSADGLPHRLDGATPVSMNMWGFTPTVAPQLEDGFRAFLATAAANPAAEYLLPDAVARLVGHGQARVRVLAGPFTWCGVTYPPDRDAVAAALARLVAAGEYPERLDQ